MYLRKWRVEKLLVVFSADEVLVISTASLQLLKTILSSCSDFSYLIRSFIDDTDLLHVATIEAK